MDANEIAILVKARDEASKTLQGVGQSAQTGLGTDFQKAATIGGAAMAAMGAAALKFGNDYDDATDTIAAATGKTGDELDALNDSMMKTFKSLPVSMGDAATAIGDLNARLGLTGKPLEDIAAKFLTLSRVTGTDVKQNIADMTRVFGDWGIQTNEQAGALDKILKASQLTGVGINQLSQQVVQFGGPMRQLGFSFDQTLAILGKFEKEGVNTELVMGSMRIALGKMAKDGEAPVETLQRVMEAIKNAGDAGEANALALEMFGARAGPDMAAAIREGRFSIDELVSQLGNAQGTIANTAASTDDWREKVTVLKNQIIGSIAPYADYAAAALTMGGSLVVTVSQAGNAVKAISGLGSAVRALGGVMTASVVTLGALAVAIGVAYAAYKLLNRGADDATKAQEQQARVADILKTNTVEQIRALHDQTEEELKAAAAHGSSYENVKKLAGLKGDLEVYDQALQQVTDSARDDALAHDGVTSAAEKMAGKVDDGRDSLNQMSARVPFVTAAMTPFHLALGFINSDLDHMIGAASNAFSALDRFKSVPTKEQIELQAAISTNNLELEKARQRLDTAKAAGNEYAAAIEEKQVKALEAQGAKLDNSMKLLQLERDATVDNGKAKEVASGQIAGLVDTEAQLKEKVDLAAAATGNQGDMIGQFIPVVNGMKERFDAIVGLLAGEFIPVTHEASTKVTELRDNFGEFTAASDIAYGATDTLREAADKLRVSLDMLATGAINGRLVPGVHDASTAVTNLKDNFGEFTSSSGGIIQSANDIAWAMANIATKAGTAAGEIERLQQLAANPVQIPQISPGPTTGPATNAGGTRNFPGGWSWVGERGPELMYLPKGADIYSNSDSRAMVAGGDGPQITVQVVVQDKALADLIDVRIVENNGRQRRAAQLAGVI